MKEIKKNEPMTILAIFAVLAIVVVVIGIFVGKVPPVTACVVILLEAALAACLSRLELWIHLIVMAAEVALGILCNQVLFMILCAVIYLAAIYTISVIRHK